ncbi:hypothetical protein Lal_00033878 [Lupinus albus]|nr:hypothetical protein Lal_00033878 [Lupinus albus]
MIPWDGCKTKQIASAPRIEDCVGCKRCESACPTDFLSVRVYLWHETTRSMGLAYSYVSKNTKRIFLPIAGVDLLLTTYAFCYHFKLDDPLIQLTENYKWIQFFDFYWRFGINGLSIGPILLTGFITTLATLAAHPVTRESRLFHFLMLAMYSGQIGPFSSRDILHHVGIRINSRLSTFIHVGGGKKRLYSTTNSNEPTLNFEMLTNRSYPVGLEIIFYIGFLIAFAVKSQIIPFHTWLPDTHGEAHYNTCMLLARILLKMGAYGLVRINMELLPRAHSIFSLWLMIIGSIQIIYAASTSLGQRNLKKRIDYSSV